METAGSRWRRSRTVRLALMGTIGLVGTLPMAGCDEAPEAQAFRTAEECIAKTGENQMCNEAAQQAQAAARSSAPAFQSRAACEATFGDCTPAAQPPSREQANAAAAIGDQQAYGSSGGSWFLPAAAGFMMGRMLGTAPSPYFMRRDGGAVAFAGGVAQPVDPRWFPDQQQQQRQSNWSTRTGYSSSSYYGSSSRSGSSSASSSTSRSGGFGSTARASGSSSSS